MDIVSPISAGISHILRIDIGPITPAGELFYRELTIVAYELEHCFMLWADDREALEI